MFFFGMLDAGIHLAPRRSAAPSLSAGEMEMDRIAESREAREAFGAHLKAAGFKTTIRYSLGAIKGTGQSAIEALFFDRYGVGKLPVMYLVLGATMFLATLGYGVLLARLGRGRACNGGGSGSACGRRSVRQPFLG